MNPVFIQPDWSVPDNIRACVTTRIGGVSQVPFDSLNIGNHVGDDPEAVRKNRALLVDTLSLPSEPAWLEQVHSRDVVNASEVSQLVRADASYTADDNVVCVVMTADCLPVFFAAKDGSEIAVAHAGWRGLASGILEATVDKLSTPATDIISWMGPAIGAEHFEVGDDVRDEFLRICSSASEAFIKKNNGKWLADIYQLARLRLQGVGLKQVYGGSYCTYRDKEQFYSYRRDHQTGRMASLIWKYKS